MVTCKCCYPVILRSESYLCKRKAVQQIELLKKVDYSQFRIFSTELDIILAEVKNCQLQEREKEAARISLKIKNFMADQEYESGLQYQQIFYEEFFEGIEEKILKWCPDILPFYQTKKNVFY